MIQSKKNKFYEVPFTIDERCLLIQGVTKWTTCSDVIKMVSNRFYSKTESRNTASFEMFVSSRDEEKQLPIKSKLVKVMRSWKPQNDSKFVMRMVRTVTRPKVSEAKRRELTRKHFSNNDPVNSQNRSQFHVTGMEGVENGRIHKPDVSSIQSLASKTFIKFPQTSGIDQPQIGSIKYHSRRHRSRQYCDNPELQRQNCISACHTNDSRNITGQSQKYIHLTDRCEPELVLQSEVKYARRKTLRSTSAERSCDCVLKQRVSCRDHAIRNRQSTPITTEKPKEDRFNHSLNDHVRLAQSIKYQIANESQKEGKEAILNKYFADYLLYQSPGQPSTCRGQGDGAEYNYDDDSFRRGDGSSFTCTSYLSNKVDRHTPFPKDTSIEDDTTSDSGQEDGEFDIAFIDNLHQDEADCVTKLVDYSLTESDISDIVGDPIYNTLNSSGVSDFVKSAFNDAIIGDEDDEIESFMNTILSDDVTDEGLSSFGSDVGN